MVMRYYYYYYYYYYVLTTNKQQNFVFLILYYYLNTISLIVMLARNYIAVGVCTDFTTTFHIVIHYINNNDNININK